MEIQWVTDKNGNDFYPVTHQKAVIVYGSKTLDKKLSEMESDISNKANPSLIPTNVSQLTNDSNYQTETQVKSTVSNEVAKIVADAPENYDTLKEISDWISGHENDASAMNSAIKDNKSAITTLQTEKANKTEIPTELPANGGNSATVNGHTVKSDVPENAKFTDTVYDDTEVQKRISDNGYGEIAGGKNLAKSYKIATTAEQYYTALSVDANLQPSTTYTISFIGASNYIGYPNEFIFITAEPFTCNGERQSITLTTKESLPEDQRVYPGWLFFKNSEGNTVMPSFTDVQIELGSEATSYEPYFPSNKMLSEEKADKSETTVNLLKPTLETTTVNGVTCTNNGDGTYTLNGTASDNTYLVLSSYRFKAAKTYRLLGVPTNLVYGIATVEIADSPYYGDHGEGVNFSFSNDFSTNIRIKVESGKTASNVTIKPMLTTNLNATYDDFVPYTGDTGSLNGDVAELRENVDNLVELGEDITD